MASISTEQDKKYVIARREYIEITARVKERGVYVYFYSNERDSDLL